MAASSLLRKARKHKVESWVDNNTGKFRSTWTLKNRKRGYQDLDSTHVVPEGPVNDDDDDEVGLVSIKCELLALSVPFTILKNDQIEHVKCAFVDACQEFQGLTYALSDVHVHINGQKIWNDMYVHYYKEVAQTKGIEIHLKPAAKARKLDAAHAFEVVVQS